jgi:type IV pilus assembly protein PilM
MSIPQRIITLSVGSQTVSLAEFRPDPKKGTLRLHGFDSRDFLPDPAADATRVSQAALLMGELVESFKAKDQPVRLTLPAQSTFSRMVKVPAMGGTELAETISHEAKQNIPYPLEEVIWDYRTVFETENHDPEVLIVAAKTDLLEEWTGMLHSAKLRPECIELSNIALLNAFRYNYGEPDGCSLLIDLGARTTNLLFIEPGKFFLRTISSGGSNLTASVAKEFGEPFSAADARKLSDGFIGQGSNFAEPPDPDHAKLAKVLRNAATRLHAEVARSVSFYRSQQAGAAPQRVFLCGGGSSMQLMVEFWEEKLGIPVERFNPLRCIGVTPPSKAAHLAKFAPLLGEHVGLALQKLLNCPVSMNLLPPAIRRKSAIGQYTLATALAAACVCAPMMAWGVHLKNATALASAKASALAPEIEEAKKWEKEIKAVRDKIQLTLNQSAPIEKAARDRRYWVSVLDSIHSCLPKELIWVTSLGIEKPSPAQAAGDTQAPSPSASANAPKPGASRVILRGFFLENPRGVDIVDEFGLALSYKSAVERAQTDKAQKAAAAVSAPKAGGAKKEAAPDEKPNDSAEISASPSEAEISRIRSECEKSKWNRDAIDKFCERLKSIPTAAHPVLFQVAPIQDWTRPTNTPSQTDWVQEFAIPIDLLDPSLPLTQNTP